MKSKSPRLCTGSAYGKAMVSHAEVTVLPAGRATGTEGVRADTC